MTNPHSAPKPSDDVHEYFGLSYSTHDVLPRVLMQSMPAAWQKQYVALMEQFHAAFEHVDQPSAYKVEAATQHLVCELTPEQMKAVGIISCHMRVENQNGGGETVDDWETDCYQDSEGNEVDGQSYVYVPAPDPLPYYARGRTYVEPRLPGCDHCPDGHAAPQSRPWGVYVAAERDGDDQPTHLRVGPSDGAHVAQSDADWLWQLIRSAVGCTCQPAGVIVSDDCPVHYDTAYDAELADHADGA